MLILVALLSLAIAIGFRRKWEGVDLFFVCLLLSFIVVFFFGFALFGEPKEVDRDLHQTTEGYVVEVTEQECRLEGISNWLVLNFCDDNTEYDVVVGPDGEPVQIEEANG